MSRLISHTLALQTVAKPTVISICIKYQYTGDNGVSAGKNESQQSRPDEETDLNGGKGEKVSLRSGFDAFEHAQTGHGDDSEILEQHPEDDRGKVIAEV